MKHNTFASFPLLTALAALALPLHAAGDIQVPWNQVCQAADGKRLTIQTADGATVDGFCMSINVDEMTISTTDNRMVKIARKTLARIDVQRSKNEGHQLRALDRDVRKGLRTSFDWLLSPSAPLGIAGVPAVLAWGAIAAPFCAIGDLTHHGEGTQQIKVM